MSKRIEWTMTPRTHRKAGVRHLTLGYLVLTLMAVTTGCQAVKDSIGEAQASLAKASSEKASSKAVCSCLNAYEYPMTDPGQIGICASMIQCSGTLLDEGQSCTRAQAGPAGVHCIERFMVSECGSIVAETFPDMVSMAQEESASTPSAPSS